MPYFIVSTPVSQTLKNEINIENQQVLELTDDNKEALLEKFKGTILTSDKDYYLLTGIKNGNKLIISETRSFNRECSLFIDPYDGHRVLNVQNIEKEFNAAIDRMNELLGSLGNRGRMLILLTNNLQTNFKKPNIDKVKLLQNYEQQFKSHFEITQPSPTQAKAIAAALPNLILKGLCTALFVIAGTLLGAGIGSLVAGPAGTAGGAVLGAKLGFIASGLIAGGTLALLYGIERNKRLGQQQFFKERFKGPLHDITKFAPRPK